MRPSWDMLFPCRFIKEMRLLPDTSSQYMNHNMIPAGEDFFLSVRKR